MDEGFETNMDTVDVDISTDIGAGDVAEDIPMDIPEDVPEDIMEDVTAYEAEQPESDIPEDVPEDITEDVTAYETEQPESDIPLVIPEDILEDTVAYEAEQPESDIPLDIPEDIPEDAVAYEAEQPESDIPMDIPEDEQVGDISAESADDAPKVLKRDEFDLLKSGNDAVNKRLEERAADYKDKGLSDEEMTDKLAADKWNFQKEFLEEAFPEQDVSPNVFNGFSENGSKDRLKEVEQSPSLVEAMRGDSTDAVAEDTMEYETANDILAPEDSDEISENAADDISSEDIVRDIVDQNVSKSVLPTNGEWSDETKAGNSDFLLSDDAEIKWNKNGSHSCTGKELKEWMEENYGVSSVSYSHKEPDFSPFEDKDIGEIVVDKMSTERTGESGTFKQAEEIAAERMNISVPELREYMSENELTWHECGDRRTIRAIPTRINSAYKHSGGISIEKSVEAMRATLKEQHGDTKYDLQRQSPVGTATGLPEAIEYQHKAFKQTKQSLFGKNGGK